MSINSTRGHIKGQMNPIQAIADEQVGHYRSTVEQIAKELNISPACASDVVYLRSRSRWSQILEEELIALHELGTPPNIFEFGCTPQTGAALLDTFKG